MGRGIATTKLFHKDEFVAEYAGDLVTGACEIHGRRQDYRSCLSRQQRKPVPCYEFQFWWKGKKHW